MVRYFLGVVAALLVLGLLVGAFVKAEPKKLASWLRRIGGVVLLALAVFLTTRGLFPYAVPLLWFGYRLLVGGTLFPSPFPGSTNKSAGQQSRVRTDYIEMQLDHDTGAMEGRVLRGRFAERSLAELTLEEALELMAECRRNDPQAAQLLEAWLDHAHPGWHESAGAEHREQPGETRAGGAMSVEEAYEILGLSPEASAAEIRKAHRALMKRLHPDQGGSNYLATKINEAKDLLLKRKS